MRLACHWFGHIQFDRYTYCIVRKQPMKYGYSGCGFYPRTTLLSTVTSSEISESLQQKLHAACGVHSNEKVCALCGGAHFIGSCDEFKSLSIDDRWRRAQLLRLCLLCFRCLNGTNLGARCKNTRKCGINRCRLSHSKLLHDVNRRNRMRLSKLNAGHMTQLESSSSTETIAPSSRGQHSLMDNLDTFSSTEFIDRSHDEPSSCEPFQPTEHPNGIIEESQPEHFFKLHIWPFG